MYDLKILILRNGLPICSFEGFSMLLEHVKPENKWLIYILSLRFLALKSKFKALEINII